MATPFRVGLCLAGAVSAGAYTAGVIDYLIEALDTWQKRKQQGEPNTPQHDVVIPVIGGASAGGMTGIITASLINQPLTPMGAFPAPLGSRQPQNGLYHSWVDLTDDDMFPLLLETDDIRKKEIYSLLNSTFIDHIARRVVNLKNPEKPEYRPYFEKHLKVFATLSNLEGFCYNIAFRSDAPTVNKYLMSRHNDFACFVLNKLDAEYGNDGWNPLDFIRGVGVDLARDAAMATGAFPAGLRARTVVRSGKRINEIPWLKELLLSNPFGPDAIVQTVNVDGGMLNNEPFEKVRDVLWDITQEGTSKKLTYDNVQSTVLMVDPFPSETSKFNPDDKLFNVLGNTLGAMRSHLLAKTEVLTEAYDSDSPGQFLIAPSRPHPGKPGVTMEGSKAIACGSLGGFGGFIHKNFRIHDFFLGRANCEHFLRCHFTVPANSNNPIFAAGYANVQDRQRFQSPTDGGFQIIPVFTQKQASIPLPSFGGSNWPVIAHGDVDRFKKALRKRTEALVMNLDDYNWHTRLLLLAGARIVLNRKIAGSVLTRIKTSLQEHLLLP